MGFEIQPGAFVSSFNSENCEFSSFDWWKRSEGDVWGVYCKNGEWRVCGPAPMAITLQTRGDLIKLAKALKIPLEGQCK